MRTVFLFYSFRRHHGFSVCPYRAPAFLSVEMQAPGYIDSTKFTPMTGRLSVLSGDGDQHNLQLHKTYNAFDTDDSSVSSESDSDEEIDDFPRQWSRHGSGLPQNYWATFQRVFWMGEESDEEASTAGQTSSTICSTHSAPPALSSTRVF